MNGADSTRQPVRDWIRGRYWFPDDDPPRWGQAHRWWHPRDRWQAREYARYTSPIDLERNGRIRLRVGMPR
jgi:hypothetical protein